MLLPDCDFEYTNEKFGGYYAMVMDVTICDATCIYTNYNTLEKNLGGNNNVFY
jgi:hypothetical protein